MSTLRLGDTAPDFTADTTAGPIRFHEYLGDGWSVLFSHPAGHTPVCATGLGAVARLKDEFARHNVKVLALSVEPLDKHGSWIADINEPQGTTVDLPLIADPDRKVAGLYDMIHPAASATATVRSVFVIGPDKAVKLIITYPAGMGRNFNELLRVIDSLQLTAYNGVATPANWQQGEDVVILPSISDEEAAQRFPAGFRTVRPCLRYTPQPGLKK